MFGYIKAEVSGEKDWTNKGSMYSCGGSRATKMETISLGEVRAPAGDGYEPWTGLRGQGKHSVLFFSLAITARANSIIPHTTVNTPPLPKIFVIPPNSGLLWIFTWLTLYSFARVV